MISGGPVMRAARPAAHFSLPTKAEQTMAKTTESAGSWLYPDRGAWEKLLHLRPKPRAVMDKPLWWRKPWPARWPGKPSAAAVSNDRKFEAVRNELAWAQKCFYYAEAVLPDSRAKEKARRIAEALGRLRMAIDGPGKAADVAGLADELSAVGRHDPAKSPRAFIEMAGQSLSAAGQILETSGFESVAYWGRVFARAGGFFRAMKRDLPGG